MAKRRDLKRWQYWRDVIQQQQASGQTITAFCRQHQISEPSFYHWRRKLALHEQEHSAPQEESSTRIGASPPFHTHSQTASTPTDSSDQNTSTNPLHPPFAQAASAPKGFSPPDALTPSTPATSSRTFAAEDASAQSIIPSSSSSPMQTREFAEETRAKFVPVHLPVSTTQTPCIEILAPNGFRIVLPTSFDTQSLRQILRILTELS